ncbi:HpcH/HpaI aldolase family protein [Sulfobacillus harzensis]|uniref:2,4-dihydroxyhept-2-ene-1,7-dioic acid aldolase n=1 Tax=Sulfobacillus harzensis TaxID=2729629 RepID=A0A7Y0L6L8_9FIRM|nr:aldolase/citrate lyase family protein [Sulfobacillus harzensis]NMP24175.1 2,4-dihydroxyhept-2-ene-1,7-dioic acid aldolase [Sulfobacillus harzensis]
MFRDRVRVGPDPLYGLFVSGPAGDPVEMAGSLGYDYVVLDGEHGAVETTLYHVIRRARLAGVSALVRVPRTKRESVAQVLDYGATGVLIPGVRADEEIRAAVTAVRYPPEGQRGLAFSVAAAQYGLESAQEYLERARRETVVLVQIETQETLHHLSQWARLPGIDGFFVGPTDLSMELGEEGQPGPRFMAAMTRIRDILGDAGKPWGIFAPNVKDGRRWAEAGARLLATADVILLRQGLDGWKEGVQHG